MAAVYSDLPSPEVPVASQVIFLTLYKFRSILVFLQRCASVWRTKRPFLPPPRGPWMLNWALVRELPEPFLRGALGWGRAGAGARGRSRGSGQEPVGLALWLELSPVDAL